MPPKKLILQFKITLKNIKPPVWRRIQVPSTYTFWDLHVAIQDAMGWRDTHLHEFQIKDPLQRKEIYIGIPDEESDFELERTTLPEWKHKVSQYVTLLHPKCEYIYDLGDNWEHSIELEGILPAEPNATYPRCIKGKRACPPEDCGGPWGYQELLEVLSDPEHEEYEDNKTWVESIKGKPFDPEHFDPSEAKFTDPKERFRVKVPY